MTVQFLTDQKGKKTGVVLSMKDWEKLQKELNTAQFYSEFRESAREIKAAKKGKKQLRDLNELLDEL